MKAIEQNYAVGWNSSAMIHNAAKVKHAVFGNAYGYLMNKGDAQMQRFASTMLDQMNFTAGKADNYNKQLGAVKSSSKSAGMKDIDYIHRKFAGDIYAKHLAKPFMSNDELNEFVLDNLLNNKPEYKELLREKKRIETVLRLKA